MGKNPGIIRKINWFINLAPCYGLMVSLALFGIFPANVSGQEIRISRSVFLGEEERPQKELPPETEIELRDEIWLVPGATLLRIESSKPKTYLVMRFRERPEEPGALRLTIVLISKPGRMDFKIKEASQLIQAGALLETKNYQLDNGRETELNGEPGRVTEIVIQDDAASELRVILQEETIILKAIPPEEGGDPSGGYKPHFFGEELTFMDYSIMGGGYTDNVYAEVKLFENFFVMANSVFVGNSFYLMRGVVRKQFLRWSRFSIVLEGGGAYYVFSPADPSDTNSDIPIYNLGITTHYRRGDWGAAAHYTVTKGGSLMMLMGGWQFSKIFGALFEYQSFKGSSGYGLGATLNLW